MQLKDPKCGPLDKNFFKLNKAVAKSQFIDEREVTGRHKLAPGSYCIVPSTFQPGEDGDFLLRVYTEKPITSRYEVRRYELCMSLPVTQSYLGLDLNHEFTEFTDTVNFGVCRDLS